MKTSWVLTEDDKSKVAIRRPASSDNEFNLFPSSTVGSEPVRIKKEAVEVEPVFSGLGVEGVHHGVKQRRPSSPLSPPFKSPSHFHSGEHHNHYSGKGITKLGSLNCIVYIHIQYWQKEFDILLLVTL